MRAICKICDRRRMHHEWAGCRGETGVGFRRRVGRALSSPGSPAHVCLGKHSRIALCEYRRCNREGKKVADSRPKKARTQDVFSSAADAWAIKHLNQIWAAILGTFIIGLG